MDKGSGTEAGARGVTLTRGGRHFGRWWAAEVETLTADGIEHAHQFIGYQGRDLVMLDGLEAARDFAAQLLAAIDYAETVLSPGA
ncbi:hypothetical protein [Demequina gelatinilytica]|uniref:hypothetical protein n=1 Tax=Demequina gelatinilytica TaxID=1638980 RepID=UPI000780570C|nr:hypothetical protein [Demequina gelatinilytica]